MKIAVLMGGDSPEREISLKTGQAVAAGLERAGHQVTSLDIPDIAAVLTLPQLADQDVVFPALHGGGGEDGRLQAVLDVMGIPYALSGPLASALAMDKGTAKRLMRGAGIPTPDWLLVTWDCRSAQPEALAGRTGSDRSRGLSLERITERVTQEIGFPLVAKLNSAGSSVGVRIVGSKADFARDFAAVAESAGTQMVDVLVEKFIPGRELTAAILLGRRLPLLEIRPKQGYYDFHNKYTAGASEYLVPAPVHSPLYEQISADALRVFDLLGCSGLARIDFRLDGEDYFCLEANTIPGMTETSLVPMAAETVGIEFDALVEDLCRAALVK